MTIPILVLRLEGALQSWGERARWDFRDTSLMPTKSGVIGLISCAMGLQRNSERIIDMFNKLSMGVRADRSGILLQDFHTVTDERNSLIRANHVKTKGSATIITPRQYLQDACFTVVLSGDLELLQEILAVLLKPVWQIFLGRKNCVPSRPIFEQLSDTYESIADALEKYPLCHRPTPKQGDFYLCEYDDVFGEAVRRDMPIDNQLRDYGFRHVKNKAFIKKEVV